MSRSLVFLSRCLLIIFSHNFLNTNCSNMYGYASITATDIHQNKENKYKDTAATTYEAIPQVWPHFESQNHNKKMRQENVMTTSTINQPLWKSSGAPTWLCMSQYKWVLPFRQWWTIVKTSPNYLCIIWIDWNYLSRNFTMCQAKLIFLLNCYDIISVLVCAYLHKRQTTFTCSHTPGRFTARVI